MFMVKIDYGKRIQNKLTKMGYFWAQLPSQYNRRLATETIALADKHLMRSRKYKNVGYFQRLRQQSGGYWETPIPEGWAIRDEGKSLVLYNESPHAGMVEFGVPSYIRPVVSPRLRVPVYPGGGFIVRPKKVKGQPPKAFLQKALEELSKDIFTLSKEELSKKYELFGAL